MRAASGSGGTAALGQVLVGTGGVGKTQLAAEYARTALDSGEVDVLVWISASSRQAIIAGYAQAGIEVLAEDPSAPEQTARAFLSWLEPKAGQQPCRWLVVLDDVADPADLRGDRPDRPGWWPPASPHGRVLVTTRRRETALTGAGRRLIPVGLFTPKKAAGYLTAVLAERHRHGPTDQINGLAADLGHLPLALAQAAAYIIDADISCADYRRLLADQRRKLADLLPEPSALPPDQATTVAATWSLSIERADRLRTAGLAQPMLQLAAMLDPNGIPETVLTSDAALAHLTTHRTPGEREPDPVTAEDAIKALRALHHLNLIDHTPGTPHQTVRIHQLIQRATRDNLPSDQRGRAARAAANALIDAWPDIERDTALAQALRANTDALTRHAEDAVYQDGGVHLALFRSGRSLGHSGQAAAARDHFQHLATETRNRLGPQHLATLNARDHLAHWRAEAGDPAGAVADFAELLGEVEQVLGPDHLYTLTIRGSLATLRGKVGDPAEAATALATLLDDFERVVGPDNPHTLTTRGLLARSWGEAGNAAKAAAALAELEVDIRRILGPDHPETLTVRNNLAVWRGKAGDAAGAATALAKLLGDRLRILGPDHPDVLDTRQDLFSWLAAAGDATGSVKVFAELLMERLRILGPDPADLALHGTLASWLGETGHEATAAAAFTAQLEHTRRVLGPDHPHTLAAHSNLARWRGQAGDVDGAVAALAELLKHLLRVLGPDHPHTLATRGNLAQWRGRAGDAVGAAAAFADLLEHTRRVLGSDHPHTLTAQRSLSHWRGRAEGASVHQPTD
ncbi:tetratricopeptide repeat protein [Streptomyces antimycoticus]|uniref:tetratricopeptide repeat protein n=1 Tax=Streptomyces antimycoticus TaxID=68175 RepID=UPI00257003C1|nr:tetratricopeptide repeat protein [Streptomyces antimycoticus]WJE00877.1 tetratricopeptide repeat protein [Streptomyces antimycoticus]